MNVSILKMYFFTSKNARVKDATVYEAAAVAFAGTSRCNVTLGRVVPSPRQIYCSLLNPRRFDSASLQMECTVLLTSFFFSPQHFDIY